MITGGVGEEGNELRTQRFATFHKEAGEGRRVCVRACVCMCVRVSRWCKLAADSIFLHKDGNCFTITDGMIIHPPAHTYAHAL